jgi:DNA-binding transcriptional LysR family regulator
VPDATRDPIAYLENNNLDIAIWDGRPSLSAAYQVNFLFEDEFMLVTAKDNRFTRLGKLNHSDLNGMDLLMYDMDEKNSTAINQYIRPNNIQIHSLTKMKLTEGIIQMVEAGLGVTSGLRRHFSDKTKWRGHSFQAFAIEC